MLESLARVLKEHKDHKKEGMATHATDSSPTRMVADSRATKLLVAGFEVEGVSIAGQETCIILPRFKVALDIGRCPQRAVHQQTVLISHGHLDHIGGLPFHVCSRNLLGVSPSNIIIPPGYDENLRKYIQASLDLQNNPPTAYDLVTLEPGQELQLPTPGFTVRPFQTTHPITSQGYVIYSQRKKLKAELAGKTQDEIKALRMAGQDVTDTVNVPMVAFTGDTTSDLFSLPNMHDVFNAKLLILEMSFIDDSVSVDEAKQKGHMHIADLVANAHLFHNEAILLIHFSARYKRQEILDGLDTFLPPGLRAKVVPLLNGYE